MNGMSTEIGSREAEAALLEGEIADVCGILNVATGRLVSLIGRVLATESYAGAGIRSPEQWVAWKCGVSLGRARALVAMARRLPELPKTRTALEAGELAEDQVAVICRYTPARNDGEAADLGRAATVAQLKRTLSRYAFDERVRPPKPEPKPEPPKREPEGTEPDAKPEPEPEEARRANFGFDDDGSWRMSAVLPADEGAVVERALSVARQRLFGGDADHTDAPTMVSWADALVAMAETSLAAEAIARPHYDRHLVVIHVGADDTGEPTGHVHLGPALPDSLRRFMTCDTKARVQTDVDGTPLSVGRKARIVPDRTRLAIEERDGGCRVPGCERTRWLHVHHVTHWEDGGTTDTANLMALCGRHHRLHHRGQLGISGDADRPDGITFTDARGRPLAPSGTPTPPTGSPPNGNWTHPTGERLDDRWIDFATPPAAPATAGEAATPSSARPPLDQERDYPEFINLDDPIYGLQDDDLDAWSA